LFFVIIVTTVIDVIMHATGIFPPIGQPMADSLFLVALAYRVIVGIAGGYITARIAPNRPMKHALVLGLIGFVLGIVGVLFTWNRGPEFGPKWYPITVAITAIPTTLLGGKLVRKV
jgi:hypothetical protein